MATLSETWTEIETKGGGFAVRLMQRTATHVDRGCAQYDLPVTLDQLHAWSYSQARAFSRALLASLSRRTGE